MMFQWKHSSLDPQDTLASATFRPDLVLYLPLVLRERIILGGGSVFSCGFPELPDPWLL